MDHYFNITLQPDAEMPAGVLMNAVFTKLHKRLCDLNSNAIGVSFPEYCVNLGDVLRIHGSGTDLMKLNNAEWLGGMKGYCTLGDVAPAPSDASHRRVSRKQPSMSQAKLKRLLKRRSITEQQIERYQNKFFAERLDNPPYVEIVSSSNGQRHRRYIKLGDLLDAPMPGEFDQFGLSKTATVPWF